ncbi:protein kinase domain protein, partial [Ichthyophthirius multifiliis]
MKQIKHFIYNENDIIGTGSYSKVYKGKNLQTSQQVAIKSIRKNQILNDIQSSKNLIREIQIQKELKSENIVNLIDFAITKNNYYIILEYCNKGNLQDFIKQSQKIPENQAKKILLQIIKGLKELNSKKIAHRDIKPSNILINKKKEKVFQVKIADFGFSCFFKDSIMTSRIGTGLYMDPSIILNDEYNEKCDIWSLGVLYYELLYGKMPWNGQNQDVLLNNIQNMNLIYDKQVKVSEISKDLLRKMLEKNSKNRISFEEVCNHVLFQPFL